MTVDPRAIARVDVTDPAAVDAYRDDVEEAYVEAMMPAVTAFLTSLVDDAAALLDAPVITAGAFAHERDVEVGPAASLAWTTVRRRWYDTIRTIARLETSLADRAVLTLLEEAMLPADAYTDVQAIMRQSIEEGWSEHATKRALSARLVPRREKGEVVGRYAARVRAAARTAATANVSRWTEEEVARTGGAYKRWVTVHDDHVRAAHAAADGQEVPIGSAFLVGGEPLAYPGDPRGSAHNVVNCRCVLVGSDGPFLSGSRALRRTLNEELDLQTLDELDDAATPLGDLFDDSAAWAARAARAARVTAMALALRPAPAPPRKSRM